MEAGGETLEAARWSARAAYWAGSSQPSEALRLWREAMELADELEESEETAALAVTSRLLQLDYAWRLGMDDDEEARLAAEAEEIATRTGDLHSLAMLRLATGARPGLLHEAKTWLAAAAETIRLADESGDLHLRVAIRAACAYARLCAGDFDGFEGELDEVLELAGGDRSIGAGIVIGSPIAWATMGKGLAERERGRLDEAEALFEEALRIAREDGDPETASWTRSNQALLLAMRGDIEGGIGARPAQLRADRAARRRLLAQPGALQPRRLPARRRRPRGRARLARRGRAHLPRGDGQRRRDGGLARGAARRALVGVGRTDEAVALATEASEIARERGMLWSLPLAILAVARTRAAAGETDVSAILDEAAAVAKQTGAVTTLAAIEEERDALAAGRT